MAKVKFKHTFLSLVVLFVGSVLVIVVRSNNRQEPKQESARQVRTEQPTALLEKNERNKVESAAYTNDSRLKSNGEEGKMTSEARRLNRDVTFLVEDSFTVLPLTAEPPAVALLKESILAIRGYIESKQSFLTDNETAIFTEYQVKVNEVLKPDSSVGQGDTIFVTRPGGCFIYCGGVLRDLHSRYSPL